MSLGSLKSDLQCRTFVQELLEPKLINLVNRYEEKLIVFWSIRERLL
jgi:hypothetical protein